MSVALHRAEGKGGGGGRGINAGGMSVNFNYDNYDMVLIKLQTKCNTN